MAQQYFVRLALAAAAVALTAGCASDPSTAPQAAAPAPDARQADKGTCYYRTGSNFCYRDSTGSADTGTLSSDQVRKAVDETQIHNMPRMRN